MTYWRLSDLAMSHVRCMRLKRTEYYEIADLYTSIRNGDVSVFSLYNQTKMSLQASFLKEGIKESNKMKFLTKFRS